jgi:hypothetical protein
MRVRRDGFGGPVTPFGMFGQNVASRGLVDLDRFPGSSHGSWLTGLSAPPWELVSNVAETQHRTVTMWVDRSGHPSAR